MMARELQLNMAVMANDTVKLCPETAFGGGPEMLLSFIDHSPAVAFLKDARGRMLYVNQTFERVFQKPAAAFLGKTDDEFWPPAVARQLRANDQTVLATGERLEIIEQVPTPDGCLRSWLSFKFRVTGPDGQHYLGGMAVDVTAREHVEKALDSERALLRTLIDNLPDLIYTKDTAGRLVLNNAAHVHFLGANRAEEVIGKTVFDFFPRAIAEQYFTDEQTIMRTGQARIEYEEPRADRHGVCGWVLTTKVPLRAADGQITGLVGVSRDITERKQTEDALRASEARFRQLVEHSPDAIFVEDLAGNVLDVNAAACQLHGLSREELIGKNVTDLVPASQREQVRAQYPGLARESAQIIEGESVHADGRIIPVELRATGIDYGGQPAVLLHVRDITERRRAEQHMREAQGRYQTLVEQLPAITYMAEFGDGRWLYVSPQIESLLGFSVAKWMTEKCPWLEHVHADDRPQVLAAEAVCQSTGEKFVAEYRMKARDGHVVWFSDHAVVVRDEAGQPRHLHGVMFDITGRKGLEEQLSQAHKMDAVGRLAGGVAHDFNNILTTILGYSELILRRTGDERTRDNATEIKKAADRAASLTRQLLAFSRKQTLQPQVLDLNAIVGEMDRMLSRLITEAIHLDVRVDPAVWRVKADPGQIQQVIMNLAVNARDAMPSGGTLAIETGNVVLDEHYVRHHADACAGEHVMLAVSDTGSGISREVKEHLFEPFFTTKGLGQGTGLGLATCYGIVKQSGGHISVYTELGRGTTFKIYLPRAVEVAEVALTPGTGAGAPRGEERVLLVEDEVPVRELSALVLRDLGYRVVEACDGDEAMRLAKEPGRKSFDLLFTDLVMPRVGGKELAYWFRLTHPSTRVLFTSGYPEKAMAHNGELVAGIAFLHKPYTPDLLARKVREVLDN